MKHLFGYNKKGFTLVEIIVGIALFGIISVSLMPILLQSFVNIKDSGHRTEAIYENQTIVETKVATNPTEEAIRITFGMKNIDIDINTYVVETTYGAIGNKSDVAYFEAK